MAGAGAKLFTSGSVLTADQVNTFLMDQSIMRFTSTTTRDAAFGGAGEPTLAEGMFAYTTDTNTLWFYTGSAWQNVLGSNIGEISTSNRNKIINGAFDIWQRGTSFSSMGFGGYTTDRFVSFMVSTLAVTVSQQSFTLGAAPVAGYESQFFHRTVVPANSGAGDYVGLQQKIENVRTLAGQTAVISFWAKANTGTPKIAVEVSQVFGSGGSPSSGVNTYVGQVTLSTSWARYSVSVAVPSISGKTIGTNGDSCLTLTAWYSAGSDFNARTGSLGNQANTFDIWGVQMEAGSVATPFEVEDIGTTLAKCQRYYQRRTGSRNFGQLTAQTSTNLYGVVPLPVSMRVPPTAIDAATLRAFDLVNAAAGFFTFALDGTTSSENMVSIAATTAGLTAFRTYYIIHDGSSSYLGVSAEL